jgi:uncharacterized protein YjbI with pentapeptide repeats
MAAPDRLSFSDKNLVGETFTDLDFCRALFRRTALTQCIFRRCDLRFADFRNAKLVRCVFEDCKFEKPEFAGAVLEGCNIEVMDGRTGPLGYVAVIGPAGLQIGCTAFSWPLATAMQPRDLLRMDKRNAVNWWGRFGVDLIEIGKRRKWV